MRGCAGRNAAECFPPPAHDFILSRQRSSSRIFGLMSSPPPSLLSQRRTYTNPLVPALLFESAEAAELASAFAGASLAAGRQRAPSSTAAAAAGAAAAAAPRVPAGRVVLPPGGLFSKLSPGLEKLLADQDALEQIFSPTFCPRVTGRAGATGSGAGGSVTGAGEAAQVESRAGASGGPSAGGGPSANQFPEHAGSGAPTHCSGELLLPAARRAAMPGASEAAGAPRPAQLATQADRGVKVRAWGQSSQAVAAPTAAPAAVGAGRTQDGPTAMAMAMAVDVHTPLYDAPVAAERKQQQRQQHQRAQEQSTAQPGPQPAPLQAVQPEAWRKKKRASSPPRTSGGGASLGFRSPLSGGKPGGGPRTRQRAGEVAHTPVGCAGGFAPVGDCGELLSAPASDGDGPRHELARARAAGEGGGAAGGRFSGPFGDGATMFDGEDSGGSGAAAAGGGTCSPVPRAALAEVFFNAAAQQPAAAAMRESDR